MGYGEYGGSVPSKALHSLLGARHTAIFSPLFIHAVSMSNKQTSKSPVKRLVRPPTFWRRFLLYHLKAAPIHSSALLRPA
jgi:hypothetical protein